MFRFSADQPHALHDGLGHGLDHSLRHCLQDFGKLTLAVMFLGSSLGLMQAQTAHHQPEPLQARPAAHQVAAFGATAIQDEASSSL